MQSKVDRLVHDVRSTLNSISMNTELAKLLSQQQPLSPDKIRHCFDVILRECQHCNALVEGYRNDVQKQPPLEERDLV